jgi:putative transposase
MIVKMNRCFKYKLYPTRSQERKMLTILSSCCELYNDALRERTDAWKKQGISVSRFDQANQLKDIRKISISQGLLYRDIQDDIINRLDSAFQGFFRRVKNGEKPGYPRFKSKSRYSSFTYPHGGREKRIVSGGKRLRISGIGNVKMRLSRPIQGKIKQITIKHTNSGKWYVSFICIDVPKNILPKTNKQVGIDFGLTSFIVKNDGESVANPQYLQKAEKKLKRAHRSVSKKKKGSKHRKKAVKQLAKKHEKVSNARKNFCYSITTQLVKQYDAIYIEDLNIQSMIKDNKLSKSIYNAVWATFTKILEDKAESAGKQVVKVDPKNTTQMCSNCGELVKKGLKDRWHSCSCGLELSRDHNAAINILKRGIALIPRGVEVPVAATMKRRSALVSG